MVRHVRRQPLERVVHQRALNLRRHTARSFVHRHDPPGMNGFTLLVLDNLVLRVRELEAAAVRAQLHRAKEDDPLSRREHVAKERLVQPRGPNRARLVGDERFEDLEPGAPRRAETAAQDAAGHRRRVTRPEGRNRQEPAAVLVAEREAVEEILDRVQPRVRQIGCATRPDALEELKRRREGVVRRVGHQRGATG
jgi:hypothetical protein